MKRIGAIVLVVLLAVGAAGWIYRDLVLFTIFAATIKPSVSFEEQVPPGMPDYQDDGSWAALPTKDDGADNRPPNLSETRPTAPAAVFFVHPTTYINKASWNAPLADEDANAFVDNFVLPGQAAAFAGCCDVYAPRYRQATLYAFLDDADGPKALDLAYSDIERAFNNFLNRIGPDTPFVLAGHSQGAGHVVTLLEKQISGSDLLTRLVAAYPIGTTVDKTDVTATMGDIPVCASAQQTGCLATWSSVGNDYTAYIDASNGVCVNPLSWKYDLAYAPHDLNRGAFSLETKTLIPGAADAQCKDGLLLISEFKTTAFDDLPLYMGKDNYHIVDIGLFFVSLRQNASARVEAHRSKPTVEADLAPTLLDD